jgi:hypothetical protein
MTAPFPLQPSRPASSKVRPEVVAKHANYGFAASFLCVVFGVVNFFGWVQPANLLMCTVFIAIGATFFVMSFGVFLGQRWALVLSGFSSSQWAQTLEVKAFFHTPPANPPPQPYMQALMTPPPTPPVNAQAPASGAPSSLPVCPTCGYPLVFLPEYNRWYCSAEKRILLENQPQNP